MNQLFPFQHSGVEFLTSRKRALISSDPGTGKTVMLIEAVNRLNVAEQGLSVLVLCPKSVRLNWEREIAKWELVSDDDSAPGRTRKTPMIPDPAANGKPGYTVSVAPCVEWEVRNWDQLVNPKKLKEILYTEVLEEPRHWDIVIADESHAAIKNHKAKRCRVFMDEIVPKAGRVWLATATPASKSGLDYYCTLKVLLPEHMEKQGWTPKKFEKEFSNEVYSPFTWNRKAYVGFKNEHILQQVFDRVRIKHRKEEVLKDLPEKIYTDLYVDVDAATRKENGELDKEFLKRIAEHGIPHTPHIAHVMQLNAMAKLPAALEWIENFPKDEPLVIFAWHQSVIQELQAVISKLQECAVINGAVSASLRQNIVDRFSEGAIKRLVLNYQAGGVGLNLQKANTALFVEFPFSPALWEQALNRIHRIGSTGKHTHLVKMIGTGTVDEAIWSVLDTRMEAMGRVGV